MCVVLVQEAAAAPHPAVAAQLAVLILDGELVVVGQLFSPVDLPQGKDDDVLAAVHVDDTRVAVRLARVVYETSCVALHRRVHHVEVVDAEHVATDALVEGDYRTELVIVFTLTAHQRLKSGGKNPAEFENTASLLQL